MLALSIRQPYAELILQGRKRIEYRTTNVTRMLRQRFYIYASKGSGLGVQGSGEEAAAKIWSDDLAVPGKKTGEPPEWMLELAEELILDKLPRGVIVGTARIEKVTRSTSSRRDLFEWHLVDVERLLRPRKPSGHPQPVWFKPF
jgi:hypothetical protein